MAFVLDLVTLVAAIFVLIFVESALFTGIAWAYHRYAEETDFGPLNFDRADQESLRKYIGLLVVLIGVPTVIIHIIGFAIRHWWLIGLSGHWVNLIVLTLLQFAILAFMIPIQFNTIDQKKATLLAGVNAAVYALLYLMVVGNLLR